MTSKRSPNEAGCRVMPQPMLHRSAPRRRRGRRYGTAGEAPVPPFRELRAGLVMVSGLDHGANSSFRLPLIRSIPWVGRGRVWMLSLLRLVALGFSASMLFLAPMKGMGMGVLGVEIRDAWNSDAETTGGSRASSTPSAPFWSPERPFPRGLEQREHVLFVGVGEEAAVEPLKAVAEEMMGRGYRASLALPAGLQQWVSDIPGLSYLPLNPAPYWDAWDQGQGLGQEEEGQEEEGQEKSQGQRRGHSPTRVNTSSSKLHTPAECPSDIHVDSPESVSIEGEQHTCGA
ncbi:unnamed protein product, partial [Discosporangium mesarthrocarpum]